MATWQQVSEYLEQLAAAEGVATNDALNRTLANTALGIMSARAGHFETHWNNDSTDTTYGTLTLTDNEVAFPQELIDITSAYWNEQKMAEAGSEAELDYRDPAWRTSTGLPWIFLRHAGGMTLNREPTGSTEGLLVVYGRGSIPLFGSGTTSPLLKLLDGYQYLFAEYIVANRPVNLQDKSDAQLAMIQEMRGLARVRWTEGLETWVQDMRARKYAPVTGA